MGNKIVLYHGTSERNAKKIEKEGFVPDKKYNWKVKSKKGFVYLSLSYAPFYCMNATRTTKYALVKVLVDTDDLYPEDDFLMCVLKNQEAPFYTQKELDKINLEDYKHLWKASLEYMGNVAVKPEKVKILGIRYFDGSKLIWKCDPVISPLNFRIMGNYYRKLTEWIFEGNDVDDFEFNL